MSEHDRDDEALRQRLALLDVPPARADEVRRAAKADYVRRSQRASAGWRRALRRAWWVAEPPLAYGFAASYLVLVLASIFAGP